MDKCGAGLPGREVWGTMGGVGVSKEFGMEMPRGRALSGVHALRHREDH